MKAYDALERYGYEGVDITLRGEFSIDEALAGANVSGSLRYEGSDIGRMEVEGSLTNDGDTFTLGFALYGPRGVEGHRFTRRYSLGIEGTYSGVFAALPGQRADYEGSPDLLLQDILRASEAGRTTRCELTLTERLGSPQHGAGKTKGIAGERPRLRASRK